MESPKMGPAYTHTGTHDSRGKMDRKMCPNQIFVLAAGIGRKSRLMDREN